MAQFALSFLMGTNRVGARFPKRNILAAFDLLSIDQHLWFPTVAATADLVNPQSLLRVSKSLFPIQLDCTKINLNSMFDQFIHSKGVQPN